MKDLMQFPDPSALSGPEPDGEENNDDQEDQQGKTKALREETEQSDKKQYTERNHAKLDIHGYNQPDGNLKPGKVYDCRKKCPQDGWFHDSFACLCRSLFDRQGKKLKKCIQEKTRKKQQVAGAHINVTDRSLEFGIQFITCAGRIKSQRITACTLKQGDAKEDCNAGGSGEENRPEMNMGKEKAEEKKEITKLGEKPLHTGILSKPPN